MSEQIEVEIEQDKPMNIKMKMEEMDVDLPCEYCYKSFGNDYALMNHKRAIHGVNNTDDRKPPVPRIMIDNERPTMVPLPNTSSDSEFTNLISQVEPRTLVNLASEDVSYIIIKTSGEVDKMTAERRSRQKKSALEKKAVELNGPFECLQPSNFVKSGVCSEIFFNCCEYSLHFREHHSKRRKMTRCQVCEKYLDQNEMSLTQGSELLCKMCGLKFSDKPSLDEHYKSEHLRIKRFECNICGKKFTQQGGLQQHNRMHLGVRPYACSMCNKAFTQKAGLEQHLRTHTKIKPFKCIVCQKSFSQSVHLKQHMRIHTNIQPFECKVCEKKFKQKSHLNFHIRAHTNDISSLSEGQRVILENIMSTQTI